MLKKKSPTMPATAESDPGDLRSDAPTLAPLRVSTISEAVALPPGSFN